MCKPHAARAAPRDAKRQLVPWQPRGGAGGVHRCERVGVLAHLGGGQAIHQQICGTLLRAGRALLQTVRLRTCTQAASKRRGERRVVLQSLITSHAAPAVSRPEWRSQSSRHDWCTCLMLPLHLQG